MKSKDDDISSDEEIISENFNEDDLEELDLNDKINTEVSNIDVAEEDDEDTKFHTNDDIDDDDNYDENDIFTDVEPEKFINQNKRIADDERSTRHHTNCAHRMKYKICQRQNFAQSGTLVKM